MNTHNDLKSYFCKLNTMQMKEALKPLRLLLQKKYDMIVVSQMLSNIAAGNISTLSDEDVRDIIDVLKLNVSNQDNTEDIEDNDTSIEILTKKNSYLISQLQETKNELEKAKNMLKKLSITKTRVATQVSDRDIDSLYFEFINNSDITAINNAYIIQIKNKIIIPKSYYEID